jgi:hypothetical protein
VKIHQAIYPTVDSISAGQFDEKFLARYADRELLDELIESVVTEHGSGEYEGAATHAKLMGCVMQRIKANHGRNIHPGWYRVMKTLREHPDILGESFSQPDNPFNGSVSEEARALYGLLRPPEPPYNYWRDGWITEAEYGMVVALARADHQTHPEFYNLTFGRQEAVSTNV